MRRRNFAVIFTLWYFGEKCVNFWLERRHLTARSFFQQSLNAYFLQKSETTFFILRSRLAMHQKRSLPFILNYCIRNRKKIEGYHHLHVGKRVLQKALTQIYKLVGPNLKKIVNLTLSSNTNRTLTVKIKIGSIHFWILWILNKSSVKSFSTNNLT